MAKTTMTITLSQELQERLEAAAEQQQKPLGEFIQDALYTYVEDIEDGVLSDVALAEDGLEHLFPEGASPVALDRAVHETSRKTA